ncbi:hypothetical protein F5887DRAFT_1015765 [Amanita rubescens]|nr:hypothetical protein F5887DRAFT_1018666 [Amanita rubescens]KAF8326178.1 hypothetical protein F5887DRAFT_1015765 [Amanita rubescens]
MRRKRHVKEKSVQSFTHAVATRMDTTSNAHSSPLGTESHVAPKVQDATGYNGLVTTESRCSSSADALPKLPNNLPFDILNIIFILALPNDEDFIKGQRLFTPELTNPLTFCGVCSLWRSSALTTPQLWKRVFVYVPVGILRAEAMSKAIDLVPWIKRSASLPLTLFLSYGLSTSLDETGPAAPVVEVLNRYGTRWETLYLQYAGARSSNYAAECRSRLFSFTGWSSLQQIYCLRRYSGPLGSATIPWSQLTHLDILGCTSYQHAMDIIKGCQKLLWLSIYINQFPQALTPPVILRNLSFLSLALENISALMSSISLPSLQEMSVHATGALQPTHLESLFSIFSQNPPVLSKNLMNVLAHSSCHFLTSLTIIDNWFHDHASVSDEVLRRLTLSQNDAVCTRLKSLTLERCIGSSFLSLLNMVKSRIGSGAGQLPDELLQSLHLQIKNVDGEDEQLDEIIKGCGMEYTSRKKSPTAYTFGLQRRGFVQRLPTNLEG